MNAEEYTMVAAKVYAGIAQGDSIDGLRYELHRADHRGWMRGFDEAKAIHKRTTDWWERCYGPLLFYFGWAMGFTFCALCFTNGWFTK